MSKWVGAERGVQRSVSPHRPLPPYVTLSASYGDRLEVSFNPSASPWHPQERSPALASREMNSRVPPKLRPFPNVHGFPVLHGQDVIPGEYYDRMSPPVRVVLLLLGALSPGLARALPLFGIVHARASGDSPEGWPSRYSPLPFPSLGRVPVFTLADSSEVG